MREVEVGFGAFILLHFIFLYIFFTLFCFTLFHFLLQGYNLNSSSATREKNTKFLTSSSSCTN